MWDDNTYRPQEYANYQILVGPKGSTISRQDQQVLNIRSFIGCIYTSINKSKYTNYTDYSSKNNLVIKITLISAPALMKEWNASLISKRNIVPCLPNKLMLTTPITMTLKGSHLLQWVWECVCDLVPWEGGPSWICVRRQCGWESLLLCKVQDLRALRQDMN